MTGVNTKPIARIDVRAEYMQQLAGSWTLHNACVAFYNVRQKTAYRAHWISRDNEAALISGFSEYNSKFHRLTWLRPATANDKLELCPARPLALAFYFSSNNIYHMFFHAVPAWQALARHADPGAVLVPLVSMHAGNWTGPWKGWASHAWEFAVRSLTRAGPDKLASDLGALLSARCTCFDRVEGNTGAFEPRAPSAGTTLREFCKISLRNSIRMANEGMVLSSLQANLLLYVSRTGKRKLMNDADALVAMRRLQPRLHHSVLEQMPVAQQMHAIARTSCLVTPHGQALAWMPFLTTAERPTAVVEIGLPFSHKTWSSMLMYGKWAATLRITHYISHARHAAHCSKQQKDDLECELLVDVRELSRLVQKALARVNTSALGTTPWRWCGGKSLRPCRTNDTMFTNAHAT